MREQLESLLEAFPDDHVEFHLIRYEQGFYEALEMTTITIFLGWKD